jgi:hypothetical protein
VVDEEGFDGADSRIDTPDTTSSWRQTAQNRTPPQMVIRD